MRMLDDRVAIKKKYCPKCISEDVKLTETLDVWEPTDKNVKPVQYWLPQIECSECGISAAFEAVDAMHDASCFAEGLFTAQQIKNVRKKHQMNQSALANLTRIPESTIKMCEARSRSLNRRDTLILEILDSYGPDLIHHLNAQKQVEAGEIPENVKQKTSSIFSEVAKQDPDKIHRAASESKDLLDLIS